MMVGSRARWMAAGSPPESTARRASSKTGSGGHQIISLSFLRFEPVSSVRLNFRWRGRESVTVGEKGTRNLRHDLSWRATTGLTSLEWGVGPKRDNKSEGVAFAIEMEEDDGVRGKDDVTENERNSANPNTEGYLIEINPPQHFTWHEWMSSKKMDYLQVVGVDILCSMILLLFFSTNLFY